MNDRKVLRHVIPVDDQWHVVNLPGPIMHVATRQENAVEVWFIGRGDQRGEAHALRVFGTGQPFPEAARHIGTAITPSGRFVWHLFQTL